LTESLDDRIADVVADMEEEEDITWGAQFFKYVLCFILYS